MKKRGAHAGARLEGLQPTPERWRRGDIEALPHAIADEAGRPARPFRKVDTLTAMLRRGTITAAMRQAGEDFHALFERAVLDPLAVPDLQRVRQGWRDADLGEAQMAARERVWRALEAVGGIASPAGSCVWHVLGCEWSVKDWALREGWGGRPLSQEQAAGVLVAALGVLAALFGV
jgi:enamine deaminase RidA (YjgF/YER057c/UK114 family)